jgi:hypothetical protein
MHPASKYSTIGAGERDVLEKQILSEYGFAIDPARPLGQHWPARRRWLIRRQRFHERLLYPDGRASFARSIAALWAGMLNVTGSRLVGY